MEGKETASAGGGNVGGPKKQRMMNIMQAIEKTLPSASAEKVIVPADVEGTAEAEAIEARPIEATEAKNLGTTMSEINKLISDMTPEIGETSTDKASEDTNLDLRHLGGQELSDEDVSELKEFALTGGYKPGSVLFGGVDEEILGCIPDQAGAKIVSTLSKNIGFSNLSGTLVIIGNNRLLEVYSTQILRYKPLCLSL
jgi:hypothetical protein